MTSRVLISAPYMLAHLEQCRSRLEEEGIEIVTLPVRERLDEADLLAVVPNLDGVICGDDPFTERVLVVAERLKVIAKWGTGTDSIDCRAAERLGIRVCSTRDAFTDPVADTVLGYVLCLARRIPWMDRDIRAGLWTKVDAVALRGATLGIVGVGNIGRAVARRARAFGMTLRGHDPVIPPASFLAETGMTMVALPELLAAADYISLNCDLNPTSFHLIGREELALVRPTAFLINTARGPIVDERALIVALQNDRLAAAALDVFDVEPLPPDSPLRALDRCLLAPHNANSDPQAFARVLETTLASLLRGLRDARVPAQDAGGTASPA